MTKRNPSPEPWIIGGDNNVCDERSVAGGKEHLGQPPKYSTPPWERCHPPVASCSTCAWLSGAPSDPVLQGGIRENVVLHLFFRNQNIIRYSHVEPSKSVDIVINFLRGKDSTQLQQPGGKRNQGKTEYEWKPIKGLRAVGEEKYCYQPQLLQILQF